VDKRTGTQIIRYELNTWNFHRSIYDGLKFEDISVNVRKRGIINMKPKDGQPYFYEA